MALSASQLPPPRGGEADTPKHVAERELPERCRNGSFFGTLKTEYFRLNRFDSIEQLQEGIAEYIHYYNHHRL